MLLSGKKIVIGITGSIAAYKIPYLIRMLVRDEAEVRIIMTPVSTDFVTPLTLATLSRNPVIIEPFKPGNGEWNNHVELGSWADLMVFAPVTANTLGKMVNGIADNFVVTAYLSAKCPVFIAPAMDLDMYNHPSTQKNIEVLKSFGNTIIEPQVGELASGLSGPGRLEEPENIHEMIKQYFAKQQSLLKKKVLVTAGPTFEPIDPVRFIGNYSSGRMGFDLAHEAALRGADVTLVSGPSSLKEKHPSVHQIDVNTSDEMYKACLKAASQADIIIMAAAVADYSVKHPSASKIKKDDQPRVIELTPTKDILRELGKHKKKNQVLVGFALETENEIKNARKKLQEKNLDLIVLNSLKDIGAGFGTLTNKISIIFRDGKVINGVLKDKKEVAADILDSVMLRISSTA